MKVKFYLKDQKAAVESVILMYCRWSAHGQKYTLKYSTKESIAKNGWDVGGQYVKKEDKGHTEKNARLTSYKTKADDLFRRYLNDNNDTAPTPEKLRALLDKIFDRIEKSKIDTKVSIKDPAFFWLD